MDINIIDLPYAIYACFVLHNYCEVSKDGRLEEQFVLSAIQDDQELQPPTQSNSFVTDCNEVEGKRVRRVVTKFLDP